MVLPCGLWLQVRKAPWRLTSAGVSSVGVVTIVGALALVLRWTMQKQCLRPPVFQASLERPAPSQLVDGIQQSSCATGDSSLLVTTRLVSLGSRREM